MNSKIITKQFAKNSLQPILKYFARNNRQIHSFQFETKRKLLFPLSGEINKQSHLFQQSKIAQVNRSFSSSVENNELPIDKRKWRHEHLKQYLNIFADQNNLNEEQVFF
jgi:hypothetical protein